ncbi:calmodulin-like protein 30 [Macadamia integrifolia]|uniref:calmodulin-like protein 30 n=1 Tax=Macadamia integrifolia TaxID=60698 RepID=UPI001C532430|nr:calmodulin-like protein 30 [Macadamia integrifolia]
MHTLPWNWVWREPTPTWWEAFPLCRVIATFEWRRIYLWLLLSRQYSGLSCGFDPNVDEMKRVFDKFDANKDGKISPEEYCSLLKALGKPRPEREVAKIFEVADLDGDGFIDFKEFMVVLCNGSGIRTMDIRNAFHIFDFDMKGRIGAKEVREMLVRLGERCSHTDCMRMVRGADANGDGFIDMDEFITMMTYTMKPI